MDDRTGYRALVRTFSDEIIPGGARWRYVFGSTLASVFLIQAVTGLLMMTAYSPSSASAWGSVYYINNVMWMGWFIRGLHHFGASTVMVLLLFHLMQTLLAGAYRKPREFNWWLGLALLVLTIGFGHTGYQLPWDQKGYWATKVVTNIMGGAPVIGPYLKTMVVGGSEYGNQTLTRLYGLHVGILPVLMMLCLWAHVMLARRHGLTPPARPDRSADETYWPAQTFRNVAFLSRLRHHGRSGSDQGRGSARRAGRSLERRLSGPARMVLPLPLPDAQAFPGPPGVGRLDRHPLDHPPGPVPAAAAGPDPALEVPSFSRVCVSLGWWEAPAT